MNFQYIKVRIKGFFQKYWGLARLAWDEFKIGGISGVVFAVRRHFKKRKGIFPVAYPTINDYKRDLVSIVILTKDRLDLIQPCLESIEKNLSGKYQAEIIIGDTGSKRRKIWKFYREFAGKYKNIRVVKLGYYFFSKNYNYLVKNYARGQYLILLNNDIIVKGNWIDALVNPLRDKKIGVVGGKLLYKNGTIQHAGMEFVGDNAVAVFKKKSKDFPEASYKAYVPVVTFACAAMRHDVYDRFELSEELREECQDTDFCLRLLEAGFRVLYNPECEIYHLECSSRDWRKGEKDRDLLRRIYGKEMEIISKEKQRAKYDPSEYKNLITVIRDDGIGDLLMGVSAFANLRKKYPDKKLILATYERNIEMMTGFGIFDEFIAIPNGKKYSPLPIPTGEGAKVYNFIDLEMDFGPIWGQVKEDNKTHRHFVYSRRMGLDEKNFELIPIPNYEQARKNVEELFKKESVDINQNFVVFNLIASNPARSWWEPYYPALIEVVESMGFMPLILGTKNSPYYRGKKIVNLVGKTKTITEFIEAVKLGKYVVSTDTSAYHIAAMAGIPFLAIFTGGMTPESRLVFYKKYEACAPPSSLSCYPCWDEGCKDLSVRCKKDPCRLIIKPEEVIEKFRKLVERYPL